MTIQPDRPAAEPASRPLAVCDKARTAELLPFPELIEAVARAAIDHENGAIVSPPRQVLPLGAGGTMLSMPASAGDLGIHKLVNVQPANRMRGLPSIHAVVSVCEAGTGQPLAVLDGTEVTGRRTAAVSLLAVRSLLGRKPGRFLLIGTGAQARYHVEALSAVHPGCTVWVRGRQEGAAQTFCAAVDGGAVDLRPCDARAVPDDIDVVIALTSSERVVYDEPARPDRLVIGVGAFKPEMAELGKTTIDGSNVFVDDPTGASHEAGDLLQAGIDGSRMRSLASALRQPPDPRQPVVFKSVGSAAWDLAAARVAMGHLIA